jgi:hypothetical protein
MSATGIVPHSQNIRPQYCTCVLRYTAAAIRNMDISGRRNTLYGERSYEFSAQEDPRSEISLTTIKKFAMDAFSIRVQHNEGNSFQLAL